VHGWNLNCSNQSTGIVIPGRGSNVLCASEKLRNNIIQAGGPVAGARGTLINYFPEEAVETVEHAAKETAEQKAPRSWQATTNPIASPGKVSAADFGQSTALWTGIPHRQYRQSRHEPYLNTSRNFDSRIGLWVDDFLAAGGALPANAGIVTAKMGLEPISISLKAYPL
jgi:hypothetical protein